MNDAETEAHFEHNIDVAWKHFLNKERKMFGEGFLLDDVIDEARDVANFAMFIGDMARQRKRVQ